MILFRDRKEAGRRLVKAIQPLLNDRERVILAIPRGGVVVAAGVASALQAPLDVIISRKICSPLNPELAVGAVTPDRATMWNKELMERLGLSEQELAGEAAAAAGEIARRAQAYREGAGALPLTNRTVILVDDGIATGFTVLAALRSIKRQLPAETILAVPVAPPEVVALLAPEVKQVVCLEMPDNFYAVSQFYASFPQAIDEEVCALLRENRQVVQQGMT